MTKEELLKVNEEYYKNVVKWFLDELAKWSKKHNMYLEDYTILRIWAIDNDEIVYEPYTRHLSDEELDKQFKDALTHLESIIEDLDELGIRTWQGLEYSDSSKFIH